MMTRQPNQTAVETAVPTGRSPRLGAAWVGAQAAGAVLAAQATPSTVRFFTLILMVCLVGCAGTHDVPVTRLPASQVERIDYTIGETEVCEIHHSKMEKTLVPIVYGLLAFPPRAQALYAASTNSFPHAGRFVNPGCMVSKEHEALVYNCPQCVAARQQWETDYDSRH